MNFNFLLAVIVICLTVMFVVDTIANAYVEGNKKMSLNDFFEKIIVKSVERNEGEDDDQN